MTVDTPPPRWLSWLDSSFIRGMTTVIAAFTLALSLYGGYRYTQLTECLNKQDISDQRRTAAIAGATDAERAADLRLLKAPSDEARREALAAREYTDKIRAAHPAPAVEPCR